MVDYSSPSFLNLVIQFVLLSLISYGYLLFTRRKYRWHGVILGIATIINTLSILAVMVPRIFLSAGSFDPPLSVGSPVLPIAHIIIGTIAEALALFLVLRWAINRFNIRGCASRPLMRWTTYTWVAASVLGIVLFGVRYAL